MIILPAPIASVERSKLPAFCRMTQTGTAGTLARLAHDPLPSDPQPRHLSRCQGRQDAAPAKSYLLGGHWEASGIPSAYAGYLFRGMRLPGQGRRSNILAGGNDERQ